MDFSVCNSNPGCVGYDIVVGFVPILLFNKSLRVGFRPYMMDSPSACGAVRQGENIGVIPGKLRVPSSVILVWRVQAGH